MKKLFLSALFGLASVSAFATIGTIVKGSVFDGFQNLLVNPSFDNTTFNTNWTTATITSAASTGTLAPGQGAQSAQLTYTNQIGSVYQLVTPPTGVQTSGVNLEAFAWVNTTISTMQVCALANGTTASCTNVPATGTWQPVAVNFAGPPNGQTVGIAIQSPSTATGTAWVDGAYVGIAGNLGTGTNMADWSNSLSITYDNQGTVTNNTVYTRRVGDSLQVQGSYVVGAPVAATYAIDLPSGYSIDTTKYGAAQQVLGVITRTSGTAGYPTATNGPVPLFYDGSTTGKIFMAYNNTQGSLTKCTGNCFSSSDLISYNFTVPILGWTSNNVAYKPDATPANWSGYQTVSSGCSTTSSTYADPSACSGIALTQLQNRNFGTVTTAASSLPGVTFNPPRVGNYLVCASVQLSTTLLATDSVRMIDSNSVVINTGKSATISAAGDASVTICGTEPAPSSSALTVKLQLAASTSTNAIVNGTASTSSAIDWSITEMDAPLPAPYLTGSVTSTYSGVLHTEAATLHCGSSSAINNQFGSWVSSIGNISSGSCAITLATGEFSAAPICNMTDTSSSSSTLAIQTSCSSATACTVHCAAGGSNCTDYIPNVICMGPR